MSGTRTRPERRGYDKITYEQHIERVKSMQPTLNCGPPRAHPLSNKREKDKIREFANIEFDNKLLLERLAKVVQQKTIDNEIHKSVQMHAQFKKKLGLTKKRLEMQKLTEENQRLLKRIQEVPPAYNHLQWEEEAKHRDVVKRCMALYPEFYERQDAEEAKKALARKAAKASGAPKQITNGGR
jgi:methylphosphotriester-DNA--protein-cysteine methyltransferase